MLQKYQKQSLWIVFDKSRRTINELQEVIREEPSPWRMRINAGAGKLLGDLYMSIERIIRLFIEDVFGEKIAKDESWHTRLIESGKAKGLVPESIDDVMWEMKNFRHRMVHGYGIDMDERKLRIAIPEAIAAYEKVEAHIRTMFPELDEKLAAAESMENR